MLVELARGASVRHGGEVLAVACGQVDGDLVLASGGADGVVRLWWRCHRDHPKKFVWGTHRD